jgi:hypothetical protein
VFGALCPSPFSAFQVKSAMAPETLPLRSRHPAPNAVPQPGSILIFQPLAPDAGGPAPSPPTTPRLWRNMVSSECPIPRHQISPTHLRARSRRPRGSTVQPPRGNASPRFTDDATASGNGGAPPRRARWGAADAAQAWRAKVKRNSPLTAARLPLATRLACASRCHCWRGEGKRFPSLHRRCSRVGDYRHGVLDAP